MHQIPKLKGTMTSRMWAHRHSHRWWKHRHNSGQHRSSICYICYVSNRVLWFSNRNQIQQCVSSRVTAAYICWCVGACNRIWQGRETNSLELRSSTSVSDKDNTGPEQVADGYTVHHLHILKPEKQSRVFLMVIEDANKSRDNNGERWRSVLGKWNIPSFLSLLHGLGWSLPSAGVKLGIQESGSAQVLKVSFPAPAAWHLNKRDPEICTGPGCLERNLFHFP